MSDADAYDWAYAGGRFTPYAEIAFHAESLASRYALVAFEGIRGYRREGGKVSFFALDEHLERLGRTLQLIGMSSPPLEQARDVSAELLQRNNVEDDCYLRICAAATGRGDIHTASAATFVISLRPMARKPWLAHDRAMNISISRWCKPDDRVFPQRAKVISNYAGPRLALLEAKTQGYDGTVLVTGQRHLSEAPTANLFIVKRGTVLTPPLDDAILDGITRRWVMQLARRSAIAVREVSLTHEDAYTAEEAFLCGTGLEFARIQSFDGHRVGPSRALFDHIVAEYFNMVRNAAPGIESDAARDAT